MVLSLLVAPEAGLAASGAETAYRKATDAYAALQAAPRKQKQRTEWEKVLRLCERVYQLEPKGKHAGEALMLAGQTLVGLHRFSRDVDDLWMAVTMYERVAREVPASPLGDDALVMAGELLEKKLDAPEEAYRCYQQAVTAYPQGDKTPQARQRLDKLIRYAPTPPAVAAAPIEQVPLATKEPAAASAGAAETRLTGIRFWSNPGYTRVVLDLTTPARFTTNFLTADPVENLPPRLFFDIGPATLDPVLKAPTIVDDGLLRRIRTGVPDNGRVRVVLDLDSIGQYKAFLLSDPSRLVIDITGVKAPQIKAPSPPSLQTAPAPSPPQLPPPAAPSRQPVEQAQQSPPPPQPQPPDARAPQATVVTPPPEPAGKPAGETSQQTGKVDEVAAVLAQVPAPEPPPIVASAPLLAGLRRIVVDAGHGGKDPGAIGPSGLQEKDVTLSLAKKVAARLRETLGCDVVLTRDRDVFLPLEERTAIANKVGADLFISVHANAAPNRQAYGIETYYLNFSKNDKAAAVAARENGTSLKEVSDLEQILFDLMANSKINESSRLAAEIQKALVQRLDDDYSEVRDLGVRQGPFYVLLGASMPSVLVEAAFISHPREEKRLSSRKYQEQTAEAIADAVKSYARAHRLIAKR